MSVGYHRLGTQERGAIPSRLSRHSRIYRLMVHFGHDPAKAGEILLDAHRGDRYARQWIGALFRGRRGVIPPPPTP